MLYCTKGAENCAGDPGRIVNPSADKGKFLFAKQPRALIRCKL